MLAVWLPLTKDIRNQGLADLTISGTPVFKNSGKLGGKSLDLNTRVSFACSALANLTTFSIAFWAKVNDDSSLSTDWVDIIGFTDATSSGTTGQLRWETCYSSSNKGRGISAHNNATYATTNNPGGSVTAKGVWTHFVFTVGADCRHYINGQLDHTSTANGGHLTGAFWLGQTGVINGEIQDVRIYDHCLSPMEVKELAKGLVLHYPLNRQGWGQENLVHNSNQFRVGGHAKGVTPSVEADGTYKVIAESGNSNYSSSWWKEVTGIEDEFAEGDAFTVSFWIKSSDANKTTPPTIYLKSGMGYYSMKGTVSANYSQVYYTGTWKKANGLAPHLGWSGLVGTYYICQWKIEKGSIPTPWCPNSSDTLATTMGLNGTTEYDCSGYCNNGTRTGTFSWTSDTPKYAVSQDCLGTNYIYLTPPSTEIQTIAVWVKWNTIPSGQSVILVDNGSGIGLGLMNTGILCSTSKAGNSYTFSKANLVANTWYHFVVVKTGTTTRKLYINGIEQTATTNTSNWTYSVNQLQVGKRSTTSDGFVGKLSDFRAYATALSADDVKSLYQNSAYIDSFGNVYGAVHSEV